MRKLHSLLGSLSILAVLPAGLAAQGMHDPDGHPIIVTATRGPRDLFDLARAGAVLDLEDLRAERQVRSLPEALKEAPGVSVQKTGHAQGSPKFRGQTGFQTLLLVDGVRVNHSAWRSGNVEYWNTVDPLALERFEVLRGPSSVLYGSDAVAGVGQAFTRGLEDPAHWNERFESSRGLLLRYASAENSIIERLETSGHAGSAFGFVAGVSHKTFGQLTAGRGFGRLPYTGYQELDADLKLVFPLGAGERLVFAAQRVDQNAGPRTHSTVFAKPWRGTTIGSDFLRDIDQERSLGYLSYIVDDAHGLFESAEFRVSYQLFEEEENRVRSNSRRRVQGLRIGQLGAAAQLRSALDEDLELAWGVEGYHEAVDSYFRELNADGSLRSVRTRGAVADEASYAQLAAYAQLEKRLSSSFDATLGARFNYFEADADDVDVPSAAGPFAPLHKAWATVVGEGSLLWRTGPSSRVFTRVAQGFRAPNLSDLTRFDVALSGDLEIPATDLDPERYLTLELGGRYDNGLRALELTSFYTVARDQIQRSPTGNIVGGDTEVTKANVGDGYYVGFELAAATSLDFLDEDEWELYATIDYVTARVDSLDANDPARTRPKGLPPAKGQFGLKWRGDEDRVSFEVFVPFAAEVPASKYNAAERRNTQRIPPGGLPGYALLGIRGSARVHDGLFASLAVENITNRDYRVMDSGLNEPGTNLVFTLRAEF